MRTFVFLVLLFFAPLQGLVLFCPFELEAVEVTTEETGSNLHTHGHGADHQDSTPDPHGSDHGHPEPDAHPHGHGHHQHDHHGYDAGEECVAMAACSAPVAPARDAAPVWGHFLGASVDMVLAEAPLAVLSPADPPPPRRT